MNGEYAVVNVVTKLPKKFFVSDHAVERARERFERIGTHNEVSGWVKMQAGVSQFVSVVQSEKYGAGRLFVNKKLKFCAVLDIDKDVVLTVYPLEAPKKITAMIGNILTKELAKMDRKLKRTLNRYTLEIAELRLQIAQLHVDKIRAKSKAKIIAIDAQLASLDTAINERAEELAKLEMERAELARGLAAYA